MFNLGFSRSIYVGLNINEIVCSDMQDAAGNVFFDRSGIWIRRHSHHSVINILVGIFLFSRLFFDLLHTVGASQFVNIRLSVHSPVSGQSP